MHSKSVNFCTKRGKAESLGSVTGSLLVLLLSAVACLADPLPRGYTARANGLDMNDDGLIGQAGVDDLVCDDTSGTGVQSNDIDGDGQA
ncbi:MAG: hypothetical protein GY769_19830, partial [bacterium]|nr:hypothetical protein [bacterium]